MTSNDVLHPDLALNNSTMMNENLNTFIATQDSVGLTLHKTWILHRWFVASKERSFKKIGMIWPSKIWSVWCDHRWRVIGGSNGDFNGVDVLPWTCKVELLVKRARLFMVWPWYNVYSILNTRYSNIYVKFYFVSIFNLFISWWLTFIAICC